jgi:hypothetical protein
MRARAREAEISDAITTIKLEAQEKALTPQGKKELAALNQDLDSARGAVKHAAAVLQEVRG